ncbi:hypothetical protein AAZX31_18G152600 [Glycine max]
MPKVDAQVPDWVQQHTWIHGIQIPITLWICWVRPPLRAVTLKVNGSMMGSPPRAGFGGLCRVHHGSFLVGLYGHVGGQEILYAEI